MSTHQRQWKCIFSSVHVSWESCKINSLNTKKWLLHLGKKKPVQDSPHLSHWETTELLYSVFRLTLSALVGLTISLWFQVSACPVEAVRMKHWLFFSWGWRSKNKKKKSELSWQFCINKLLYNKAKISTSVFDFHPHARLLGSEPFSSSRSRDA